MRHGWHAGCAAAWGAFSGFSDLNMGSMAPRRNLDLPTIPILLTSSIIAHDHGVKLKDSDARLHHTLESVEQWLHIAPGHPITLCDGSSVDLQTHVAQRFPGAPIECLAFANDQARVSHFGRGYGEGEIVKYALQHSRFIREAGCFAKCSSKLWVENFDECLQWWNGRLLCKGVFLDAFSPFQATVLQHIDTRFYMASIPVYEKYLVDAHHGIDVSAGRGLEECFHEVLLRNRMEQCLMPVPPIIGGVGGGTGHYYKNPGKRILKERLRFFLVRHGHRYQDLFSKGMPGAGPDAR